MSYFRSNIQSMAGYVPGEQPQGDGFVKLNTNENPYPPSPAVAAAIGEALRRGLRKYPDPMAGVFRCAASEALGVPPDWILAGNGSDDILTIVTRALVGEGQLLRMPYPSYILYHTLAELQAARCEEVPFESDWSLPDAFAAGRDDLRLAILANPNSPSGTVVPPERVLELAECLQCPLLVDEAYADFAATNCMDLVAKNERVMVSRSLSKSYALAGLRFGYLVAQPQLIEQFVKVKDSYNCDALAIAAAAAAVGDREWLATNREKIVHARGRLTTALRDIGFIVPESQANFVWALHGRLAVRPMYEELKRRKILVRYMVYPGWSDGLRISVGADEEVAACIEALRELV